MISSYANGSIAVFCVIILFKQGSNLVLPIIKTNCKDLSVKDRQQSVQRCDQSRQQSKSNIASSPLATKLLEIFGGDTKALMTDQIFWTKENTLTYG